MHIAWIEHIPGRLRFSGDFFTLFGFQIKDVIIT